MKRKRFSEEQIIAILRSTRLGVATADLCRKHGMSNASFYAWKSKYGGMDVSDAKKLKSLEDGKRQAEAAVGRRDARQRGAERFARKKMVTLAQRREAIAHLETAHEMSERRACRVIGVDRTSVRYQRTKPDDAELRARITALAHERRRFGYRRLYILLRREGRLVNRKRVQRIYQEERLMVRRRSGRKRALGLRAPMAAPDRPNACWSLDFVHDQMTDGRRFRVLAVVDNCTRECLALVADTSISGVRVARELDRIIAGRGRPGCRDLGQRDRADLERDLEMGR